MPLPTTRSTLSRLREVVADTRFRLVAGLILLAAAANALRPDRSPESRIAPAPAMAAVAAPAAAALRDALGKGETLSQIWERNGRPRAEMVAVVEAANAVFDVRQLRAGTPIEFYLDLEGLRDSRVGLRDSGVGLRDSRVGLRDSGVGLRDSGVGLPSSGGALGDSPAGLDSVVIRVNADRTVAIRAGGVGAFRAELRETPVREVLRTHVGCIETSLYGALTTRSDDFSLLALELDKIYGGLIDFYSDLQPGDCVSLSFQTFVRPDGSLRFGRIESAELVNGGRRNVAVHFAAPDGTADYYDAEGKSLKRQFLRSPLKFTRISSGFTLRRYHPVLKRYRAHPGIDYAAPAGTPVQAAGNGVVRFAGWKRGYGKFVTIGHGKVYETSYAHLSRIPRGIRSGVRVSQGEVIGYVGSTGLSTGPHLDYRFTKNGKFVNPLDESLPTGEPVAPQYVTLFAERRDRALQRLEEAYRTVLVDGGPEARQETSFGDD
jgi:murein DD-endopeptidase MepM/ murein hydrolase activator NlpD